MKNMRVSAKLIVSFLVTIVLTAAVGGGGIFGMITTSNTNERMYETSTVPLPYIADVIENVQRIRVNVRQYVIDVLQENQAGVEQTYATIEDYKRTVSGSLDSFGATIDDPEVDRAYREARALFEGEYAAHLDRVHAAARDGDVMGIVAELDSGKVYTDRIVQDLETCMEKMVQNAAAANQSNSQMATLLLIVIISSLVIAVVVSMVLALYVSRLISRPLVALSTFMKKAGTTGDITLTPKDAKEIEEYSQSKDEIGQTIDNTASFIRHVIYVAEELETVANGDLTSEVKLLSDRDTMGKSICQVVENLGSMFAEIQSSTNQVSAGARQVAEAAQSLAQGATEQAASVQELSSAISEIAEKTRANATMAGKTSELSESIKENAERGSRQMDDMIVAVNDINDASKNISMIIKTIDDIAFQTNILALNAAVEAARAGQHGKGFAVVAEEVRNLASKSAEAAKDTGDMIQNSMEKAELGSRIAGETASSLRDIVLGIGESSQLIGEIARASEEQSQGITHINSGIDQVALVVQQNSATAEESAAASQEMSSQSTILEEMIAQFKLKDDEVKLQSLPARMTVERPGQKRRAKPRAMEAEISEDEREGFGKY